MILRYPDRHLVAGQGRHPGRIVENGAGVVGYGGGTRIGSAQAAGVLLPQLEGGGGCRAGKGHQQQGGQGTQGQSVHYRVR